MAIDEALLRSASSRPGLTTLRFYQWSEATLSLGYFQSCEERNSHHLSRNCQLVRRSTGGGAILHDAELTYSLTTPIENRLSNQAGHFYEQLHGTLTEALSRLGVACEQFSHGAKIRRNDEPFLCFHRRTMGDVICAGHKIGGSAQRRRQGGLLQHGSVLLSTSNKAPELPGIKQLTDVRLTAEDLISCWLPVIVKTLGFYELKSPYSEKELAWAKSFAKHKFGHQDWTNRR